MSDKEVQPRKASIPIPVTISCRLNSGKLEHDLKDLRPGQLAENLREIDSPYNTYLYPGLPPTPIGNPGRAAIEAVLYPTESNFLYYLTGDDGEFYYAKNYNQHLVKIAKHLR